MFHGEISTLIGGSLVALGVFILFFSPYRRWLGFMLAGMLFWCFMEIARVSSQYLFSFNEFQGYMTGLGITLALLATWLAATDKQSRPEPELQKCIEHTPVYEDDLATISRSHR